MGLSKPVNGHKVMVSQATLMRVALFAVVVVGVLSAPDMAFATSNDFESYAQDVGDRANLLADVIAYISFIVGAVYCATGLSELRRVGDGSAGGSLMLRHPLAKLFFGGMFLAFPFIAGVLFETMRSSAYFTILELGAYDFADGGRASGGIGDLIAKGINNTMVLVNVAAFVSFLVGAWFTARGLQILKDHIENPGQHAVSQAIKYLAVGGVSFSLPMISEIIYRTFGAAGNSALGTSGWSVGGVTANGLDGMMINFIKDLANPAYIAIEFFCYIAGILMILFALQRLVRTAQDGPRGPLGFGTITMIFVAGALLSFPQLLTVLDNSLLATGGAKTSVDFMALSTAVDAQQVQNAKNVFSAVIAFMAVVGFLSVVRGLFLLKAFADGNQQASMMSVVTHIVAGSIAINLGAFINAVQTSLGITDFAVTFS